MIELDEFLREVSAEPPCGPDLTYDADFLALESAARGKNEQQFGTTVIPAEPPDWREVEKRASALMGRSKDIRVAVALCRAWVNVKGLPGFAAGIGLVCGLLERYWETVHPVAEEGDYFMRMNAVSSLNEVTGLLRDLRQVDFLRSSAGAVSVRDAEALARGNTVEGGHQMSLDQLRLAVQDACRQENPILVAAAEAREFLTRIVNLCVANLPGAQRPETDGLQSLLAALHELMPSTTSEPSSDSDASPSSVAQGVQNQAPQPGVLRSRDDAIAQLLAVAAFVEKTEPTNPAPLLIRRAARLMRMGFIDILRELSPASLSQIETITGGSTPP
ncbi:MAG: type VI secretion system protein TssA [Rhizobacter sp.]